MIARALGLKLGRFGLVGVTSALVYAAIATIGTRWTPLPLVLVTSIAFAASGLCSYIGHYHLTFRSDAAHRTSLAKFAVLFAVGYAVATALVMLNRSVGLPPEIGTITVTLVLPVLNFVIMQLWVFAGRRALSRPSAGGGVLP